MNMKKMLMLAAGSLAVAAEALTLSVTNVTIAQRYPWNGLVDIDYTITCDDANADVWVYPVGYDADFNTSVAPRTLTGDGANGQPVKAGTHRMTWNMAADMPANYNRAKFSMKMHAYAGAAPYMVIDLSAGPDAEKYTVSYLTEIPGGEWSDEYKTTNLVLKLVVPGTFMMGTSVDEPGHSFINAKYETQHEVTLTQPFYMGVFELTQKQYELVMGENPIVSGSSYLGDLKPVCEVSYDMLRGSDFGGQWPNRSQVDETSFFGKLRSRTGITFDLPTEAQWEYTCRAGTGTALNSNKDLNENNAKEVGGHKRGGADVGTFLPNAWGFYNMHGNVAEWCRDWWQDQLSGTMRDPNGPESGSYRVVRGGGFWYQRNSSWYNSELNFMYPLRSGARNFYVSNSRSESNLVSVYVGFRLAAYPAE